MKRFLAILVCFALIHLSACGSIEFDVDQAASPIVGGTLTTGYPSVGYLESGGTTCSSTLITNKAALTAAHCIDSSSGNWIAEGRTYRWSRRYIHPTPRDNDLAVVILDSAVGITPSPLNESAVSRGQPITLVGFGYTSDSGGNSQGRKYVGTNVISEITADELRYRNNANICNGDSGGPSFIGDKVAGVHSWGEGSGYCTTGIGADMRVDAAAAWIKSVAEIDDGSDDCKDTPGFIDAQGYSCADWIGYDCDRAVEDWDYTADQEAAIKANCKLSCDLCDDGGGGNECLDTPGFTDAQGYSCADWIGYDCDRAVEDWNYTAAQEAAIKENCPVSCNLCDDGGGDDGGIDKFKVYYGLIHSHTGFSDGTGTPDQAYRYARDTAKLDFFSLADHDYMLSSSEWSTIKSVANNYNSSTFVTFWGYEWTSSNGHIAVINSNDICNSGSNSCSSPSQLSSWLSSRDAIAFFNHPGDYGNNFNSFQFTRTDKIVGIELWNRNSGFKYVSFFNQAIKAGWYLGAGGSDDNHSGTWGRANSYRLGVLANSKTRAEIYAAIKARRFFSTADSNLKLSLTGNGSQMGSRIPAGSVNFNIQALDGNNETFTKIQLIKNGTKIKEWSVSSATPSVSITQTGVRGDYFYAIVKQSDGNQAYSSPIFIQ